MEQQDLNHHTKALTDAAMTGAAVAAINPTAGLAAGAIDAVQNITEDDPHATQSKMLHELLLLTRYQNKLLESLISREKDSGEIIVLQQNVPFRLETRGHAHSEIYVTSSVQVQFEIPGLAKHYRYLVAGWNKLDFPNGTTITVTFGDSSIPALLRTTNVGNGHTI